MPTLTEKPIRRELETLVASLALSTSTGSREGWCDYEQAKKQIWDAAQDHREYAVAIRMYARLAQL
jgi:hypothetical protein